MDIALTFDPNTLVGDLAIAGGGLVMDGGLTTAVMMSLFTDRRADADDPIDPLTDDGDRRGWPGDLLNEPGDRIGSRIWLLRRAKLTEETRALLELYAAEALQWLVDDGVADTVVCTATIVQPEAISLVNQVMRGGKPLGRWDFVWNAQAGLQVTA
jgi:phage gp46-like protein